MASSPLLGPKNVLTLTLLAPGLETVATTLMPLWHVLLRKSMEQLFILATNFVLLFSNVRCGQLHCRDSGDFRLSVGAGVTILTRSAIVSGRRTVQCR